MRDALFSITLVMTDRQLRHLRQACADYATDRYEARLARPTPYCVRPSATEQIAAEVERHVFRACEIKFPMGHVPEEVVR